MSEDKKSTGQVMGREAFLKALSKRPKTFKDEGDELKKGLPVPSGQVRAFVCGPHTDKKK